MKRAFTILTVVVTGMTGAPTFANNWQWQLGQIKVDQQRRAKCRAAEQANAIVNKLRDAQKKAAAPVPAPLSK